jgi:hypothetical protein
MLFATSAFAFEPKDLLSDMSVSAGVGLGNFTGDLGSLTSPGVAWNGRVAVNPWPFFGGELQYQGVNAGVGAVITPGQTPLLGQSMVQQEISVDAKGSYPILIGDRYLKPYGFLGIGGAWVSSNTFLSAVGLQGSGAFAVPFGVGASYDITDTFLLDGRFTYNVMTGTRTTLAPSGDAWNAVIDLGARFTIGGM